MLLTTMALAAAMLAPPGDKTGRWLVVEETPASSVALQIDGWTPAPGARGGVYVLTTHAQPRVRRDGRAYRQTWVDLSISCPGEGHGGYYSDIEHLIAEPSQPLPADQLVAPVARRSFDDDYFGPLALSVCNGEHNGSPVVEGEWATVLEALIARSDAYRQD